MIFSSDLRTALVHFDAGADVMGRCASHNGRGPALSEGTIARMRWYLEWTAEGGRTVHVLLPGDLESQDHELLGAGASGKVVRYRDEGDLSLPLPRRRGFTFVINGNQFPIVHWRRAIASAQRHSTDVLVFGPSGRQSGTDYPESVLIDADGQVVRFKRHYIDSPGYADRWSGDAAFLVVKNEHAQAVAAHVVVRGWGLDSIGALVRRFGVRWLNDNGVLSNDRLGVDDLSELSRDIAINWNAPIQSTNGEQNAATRNPRAQIQIYPRAIHEIQEDHINGIVHEYRVDDSTRTDVPRSSIDGSSGEFTLATDDLPEINESCGYLFAKRLLDLTASAAALVVLSPFLLLIACLIKLTSRGPILYAHTRQGLDGKEFPCLKFRSMRTGAHAIQDQLRALNEVDGPQFKMARDPRVTRLGSWLRKTNIDELPQLFNVLVGQMSLVGPRPSPDQENQYCPAWRRARLSTKPGITGLWQVLRNREECASDFQEWIYYDVEYARHRCFWLDLQILFYTPLAMYSPRHVAPFAARLERADICAHSDKMVFKSA